MTRNKQHFNVLTKDDKEAINNGSGSNKGTEEKLGIDRWELSEAEK